MVNTARRTLPLLGVALCIAIAAITGPAADVARAQDAGEISLPENSMIFGTNDPNTRHAAVRVNGEVITGTDIDQRLALILAANNQAMSDQEKERLRMQVVRNLIDETLQIQEAKAQEMVIGQDEIDQTYARVASSNFGTNIKAMDDYLYRIGSSPTSLKRQIEGELAWQRLLRRNVEPFVNVSEEEVHEVLDRMQASRGTNEYRLGEIYLSAAPDNKPAVFENAKRIVEQIKQGGSFTAYARQFSEASTAAVGGDLGWVRLAQLPPEIANVAQRMDRGQFVGPVEVPGGFSILYLIDKRQVLIADPRDARLSLKQIGIKFPEGSDMTAIKRKVTQFAEQVKQIKGCGEVDAAAAAMGASVVSNDDLRIRDLPPQLQDLMMSLQVGQSTPPSGSAKDGVSVLMLCGRDEAEGADGPSFDQLMTQLEDERVGKRAQRYLRDLRRDAVIDYY